VKGATADGIVYNILLVISIHAPVKGATERDLRDLAAVLVISIHAPVKGATLRNARLLNANSFQSTHP